MSSTEKPTAADSRAASADGACLPRLAVFPAVPEFETGADLAKLVAIAAIGEDFVS